MLDRCQDCCRCTAEIYPTSSHGLLVRLSLPCGYPECCSGDNLLHIKRNYRGLGTCLANPGRRKDWVEVDCMASLEDGALASRTREMRAT